MKQLSLMDVITKQFNAIPKGIDTYVPSPLFVSRSVNLALHRAAFTFLRDGHSARQQDSVYLLAVELIMTEIIVK
jgi:hypothetical protein